jgi:hypothetical protein
MVHHHVLCKQGVRYNVADEDKGIVCRHPHTRELSWRNRTDPLTGDPTPTPVGVQTSDGWAYDCNPSRRQGHPYGQFCTPFKNPEAEGFPDSVPGYNSLDNILLSWITIVQHVSAV